MLKSSICVDEIISTANTRFQGTVWGMRQNAGTLTNPEVAGKWTFITTAITYLSYLLYNSV